MKVQSSEFSVQRSAFRFTFVSCERPVVYQNSEP
jgi:hypothetical protein